VLAFVHVYLHTHDAKSVQAFQHLVALNNAIQEAHFVSGEADYILKVVAENLEQLADFVTNTLLVHDTIARVKSHIVFRQVKQTSQLPTKS
jgi:DNA-binding Lrp family transcriptional regulator